MAPVKETTHQKQKPLSKRAAKAARKQELEEKTKRKAENREKAKQEELLAAAVGGMRETAVDVEQRALMRGLEEKGAGEIGVGGVVGVGGEGGEEVEETAEKMEKMNLSE